MERLKKICEHVLIQMICTDTVSELLSIAEMYQGMRLKEKCINFMVTNFDTVSKSKCFEEMGRSNIDLLFEVLKRR